MWVFYALVSALFAALTAIFGKIGLKEIDSTLATTVRSFIMAGFLGITAIALKKFQGFSLDSFTNKEWLFVVLSGVAGALSWLFYFYALKSGSALGVSVVDRLSIIFVFVLAVMFLGESFTMPKVLGVILIAIGAFLTTMK
ncbi:MAG: EamA family transporter [Candidatus Zambryskibacteria bacterium]|nr:EamA family transporter [Candidatus Zambryskibacteria bacterium]